MIGRSEHLHDDCLVECYFADRRGEALDPPSAEHLADCDACGMRYAELVTCLDDVRTVSDAESDAVFTTERLRQQQEQILRRLEHASRSARVISFPGQSLSHPIVGAGRVAPRWLAAAAAAGLFVGVAVGGTILHPGLQRSVIPMRVATSPVASARLAPTPAVLVNAPANVIDSIDDDAFLMQLEFALERPHTQELQPFDALTPHVREIGVNTR
jgi:anti-sigma factor RsiW